MLMNRARFPVSLLFSAALAWSALANDGDLNLSAGTAREAIVNLPGGQVKLTLVKGWGRTGDPKPDGAVWKAEGAKLPAIATKTGEDWVEISIPQRLERNDRIRIYRFDLDLSGAAAWADADGARTFLRRGPQWQPVSELLARQNPLPVGWAWPVVPGLTGLHEKSVTKYSMGAHDLWTGFSNDYLAGMADPLYTADVSAIVRIDGSGRMLALVAERAIAIGWERGKITLCTVLRDGRAGEELPLRLRLYCGKGQVGELAGKWVAEMDRVPLRVVFCGDSVGAEGGGYTSRLAAGLIQEFGEKVRPLNTSRGGATTREFLDVWQPRVMDYSPNLAIFQLCYNDVLKIKPEDVAANLKKMIDSLLANTGGRAVVCTPLSYDQKRVNETMAKGTDINKVHREQYIPVLQALVADYEADPKTQGKVAFANIWEAMATVRAEKGADYVLLPDGSHPNAEGHKILADTIWPELKRLAEAALKEIEEKQ
jgi:lysophospholipase L1-like esterase